MLIDRQMLRVLIEADSDRLRKLQLTGKDHGPGFPAAIEADLRRDSEAGYRGSRQGQ